MRGNPRLCCQGGGGARQCVGLAFGGRPWVDNPVVFGTEPYLCALAEGGDVNLRLPYEENQTTFNIMFICLQIAKLIRSSWC